MSISNYIRRTGREDREDINRLLGLLSDIFYPEPEEGSIRERIALTGTQKRKRTETIASGAPDVESSISRDRQCGESVSTFDASPTFQVPSTCQTFEYVQTTNGTPTFHDTDTTFTTTEAKFGGKVGFGGTNEYLTLANIVGGLLDLERTDAFSIAFMFRRTNDGTLDTIIAKRDDIAASDVGYSVIMSANGEIVFDISDGTTEMQIRSSIDQDDDAWHTCVCTYSGNSSETGMTLYIDAVDDGTTGSDTVSSTIINTKVFSIGAESDAGDKFTGSLAWVMVIKEELTSGWATNYNLGHFDWSAGNLILFMPGLGEATIFGEATTPFCVSS